MAGEHVRHPIVWLCVLVFGATSLLPRATASPATRQIEGTVRFEGAVPAAVPIDMSADAYCAPANAAQPAVKRPFDVGANGGVKDVVVHVRSRVSGGTRALPVAPVVLDQKGCIYRPGVLALAVQQPLVIRNSDATLHNVHVRAKANRSFNLGQPRAGSESRRVFGSPELDIAVSCDVHAWMAGAIAVFDHAYFAVTAADGTFAIDGLPAGEYTLEAWHPQLGTQAMKVSVTADVAAARAAFVFRGS